MPEIKINVVMKKVILIFSAIVAIALVGCDEKNVPQSPNSKTETTQGDKTENGNDSIPDQETGDKEDEEQDFRDLYVGTYYCTHSALSIKMYDEKGNYAGNFNMKEGYGTIDITKTDTGVVFKSSYYGEFNGGVDNLGYLFLSPKTITSGYTTSVLTPKKALIKDRVLEIEVKNEVTVNNGVVCHKGVGYQTILAVMENK